MNLVILDGTINSLIERVLDPRRARARFTVSTITGDDVGVEVRGGGADRLCKEWEPGDAVHVRGRLTAAGYVAADTIRRLKKNDNEQGAGPMGRDIPASRSEQISWVFFRPRPDLALS